MSGKLRILNRQTVSLWVEALRDALQRETADPKRSGETNVGTQDAGLG